MNTVKHVVTVQSKHRVSMQGPITRRDIGDFIHQADQIFSEHTGRGVNYDDDYYIEPTDDGVVAVFNTEAPMLDVEKDDRVIAWVRLAGHPFFTTCYQSRSTLINAMLDKLDELIGEDK